MGVKWEECEEVARLVGVKTLVNEFVAYQQMGESKRAGLLTVSNSVFIPYLGETEPSRLNSVDKFKMLTKLKHSGLFIH
jgi:pyrimidine nucleoside transport protein